MFYQILFSPQVKRWAIITYKHGINELPDKLSSVLGFRILGYYEISGKCLNFINDVLVPSLLAKKKNLLMLANFWKTETKLFP